MVGLIALLVGLSGCSGSSSSQPSSPPPASGNCGPPAYSCTAQNNASLPGGALAVVNYPNPVPNMGTLTGAGTVLNDPDFGNPIARCTDANTDPGNPNTSFDTNGGGAALVNHFNQNDTLVYVQERGGRGVPLLFDPNALKCARMYPNNPAYAANGGLTIQGVGGDFSYSNPNWLYIWDSAGGQAQLLRYDFSNYTSSGAPTVTVIADFLADSGDGFTGTPGNCLPLNFVPNWVGHDGPSNDDTIFTAAYSQGVQNTGFYVLAWKVGAGCRVYNTQTGVVSGDWGPAGPVSVFQGSSTSADSPTDQFYVHSIFVNLTGEYAQVANGGCVAGNTSCLNTQGHGPYLWQISTTNVFRVAQQWSGEAAFGWNDFVNRNGNPLGQYEVRPFNALDSPRAAIQTLPQGMSPNLQGHPSWVNDNASDSMAFFDSLLTPLYYKASFPSAWTNEIIGVLPDGSTRRFAHNFVTMSNPQFSTNFAIGSVSQSGKFFMQSSDWVGTLGSLSGSTSCLWGYDWAANQTYPANFQYLAPQAGNAGGFVYQATACSGTCTSGGVEPNTWNQTAGGTTSDGTITWTNLGPLNCRGDVFIVRLQ